MAIYEHRLDRRTADELIGICRGILADSTINISEARYLSDWIARHPPQTNLSLFADLNDALSGVSNTPALTPAQQSSILSAISNLVGGEHYSVANPSLSCTSPLDHPPPRMNPARTFVLTGKFRCGSREDIGAAIIHLGGGVAEDVRKHTTYLLVGEIASKDWAHSAFGRKIEAAIHLRTKGHGVAIVSESHWLASFPEADELLRPR